MEKISKKMKIGDVLDKFPETLKVFTEYGFHCIGCAASNFETIEDGANAHNIDVDKFVEELNKTLSVED